MKFVRGVEVADRVYRFGTRRINWYVAEADDALTVVDAGLPGHWDLLVKGVEALGYTFPTSKRFSSHTPTSTISASPSGFE